MRLTKRGLTAGVTALTLLTANAAFADPVKREGVIISQTDTALSVRTREGPLTVVLSPDTQIKETSGLSKSDRDTKSLIPGLIITVKGEQQGDSISAQRIEFKKNDWRAAIATKAGTQEQFSELRNAIIEGQEYVIREEATVFFRSGSSTIAPEYKQQLRDLAGKAKPLGNYRISILGFADQRGNAEANERLSMKRAMAVSNFIRQTGLIEPGRVLSPSAMGEGTTAPAEKTPVGDDEARRVLVRLVTPKTQLTR
jgi:outer membrane protein OmpA-like peptidoglycan-associated protein